MEEDALELDANLEQSEGLMEAPKVVSRIKSKTKKRRLNRPMSLSDSESREGYTSAAVSGDELVTSRVKEFLETKRIDTGADVVTLSNASKDSRKALDITNNKASDDCTVASINRQVIDDVEVILSVASKARNLKSTYKHALKDAATSIKAAATALQNRSSSEEVIRLQKENTRLQQSLEELRKELVELRRVVTNKTTDVCSCQSLQADDLASSIMRQVGNLMSARFEALEERLLPQKRTRPPLAADERNAIERSLEKPLSARKVKKMAKKSAPATVSLSVTRAVEEQRPVEMVRPIDQEWSVKKGGTRDDNWVTVGKRGKSKKAPTIGNNSASKPAKQNIGSSAVKLRPPRSAAVVITMQPEAENSGLTYAKILTEARKKIDLHSLGIKALRCRQAATGARILEIPGATSGDKADSLAKVLKDTFSEEIAKVSRPIKFAELRISGLDDSINTEEVVAAVAQRGECTVESIKCGEIRYTAKGTGSIWIRCPVTAAKKMVDNGRFLVGWVSAHVLLLKPRPLRCYKCLQIGHVQALCTEDVDRSNHCYRCSQKGHKASGCLAEPKCLLCSETNRPADHIIGSKKCTPPKIKNSRREVINQAEEAEVMETTDT